MEVRPELLVVFVILIVMFTYSVAKDDNVPQGPVYTVPGAEQPQVTVQPVQPTKTVIIKKPVVKKVIRRPVVRKVYRPRRINVNVNEHKPHPHAHVSPLREFDYRAVHDKLIPPRQRNIHEAGYIEPALAPIYSRGIPSPFRKVGILKVINDSEDPETEYRLLHLMGSKLPHTDQYSYYAVSTRADDNAKFNIDTRRKEIFDGDDVEVDVIGKKYKVTLDKNALPLYLGYDH